MNSDASNGVANASPATDNFRSVSGGGGHIGVEETNSEASDGSATASPATDNSRSVSRGGGNMRVFHEEM